MMPVNSAFVCSPTVVSALTSSRMMSLNGTLELALMDSFIFARARSSMPFNSAASFARSAGVGDVVMHGGLQDHRHVLRHVGQRGVRAGGDAFHALRAILGDINRRFAAGDVLGLGRARAGAHDAERRERAGRLVIAEAVAEFGIELGQRLEGVARRLLRGRGNARAAGRPAAGGRNQRLVLVRRDRRIAHRGTVRVVELAVLDFLHARETLVHDGHVRRDDVVAEAPEFLLVLFLDRGMEGFVGDIVLPEERRDAEERAQERIALHAQLQLGLVRSLSWRCRTRAGCKRGCRYP